MPKRQSKDPNQNAAALVRKATGTKKARVSELLPPELRKKYREAKRKAR